jgi:hypothetical protein
MSARDDIVALDAAWLEQRQAWLGVALVRVQKARERVSRINVARCTVAERTEANAAAREASMALARAMRIRRELVVAGYGAEPWLEEQYRAITQAAS